MVAPLYGTYLPGPGVEVEAECVASDASGAGLGQVQHGCHGHAGVSRVPARLQDRRAATTMEGMIWSQVGKLATPVR